MTNNPQPFELIRRQIAAYRLASDQSWREVSVHMKRLTGFTMPERTLRQVILGSARLPHDRTRHKLTLFAEALAAPPPRRRGPAARSSSAESRP